MRIFATAKDVPDKVQAVQMDDGRFVALEDVVPLAGSELAAVMKRDRCLETLKALDNSAAQLADQREDMEAVRAMVEPKCPAEIIRVSGKFFKPK